MRHLLIVAFAVSLCWCVPSTPLIMTPLSAPSRKEVKTNQPTNFLYGVEWWMINGKTGDQCVIREQIGGYLESQITKKHCVEETVPESSNTLLVPTGGLPIPPLFTVTGKNIPIGTFFLSTPGKGCDFIDGNLVGAAASPLACANYTFPWASPPPSEQQQLCTSLQFNVPSDWMTQEKEFEQFPRSLCYTPKNRGSAFYTGFKVGVVWNCNDADPSRTCDKMPVLNSSRLTPTEIKLRMARTTCCRHATVGTENVQFAIGQCINPSVQSCCQGAAVNPLNSRCCNIQYELTQFHNKPCPCRNKSSVTCPSGESCCEFTKYPELTSYTATWPQMAGECYNPNIMQCCDTGHRFDPGRHQCCSVNGIQSLNVPCPCVQDSDCRGGQTVKKPFGAEGTQICCKQTGPPPFESDLFQFGGEVVVSMGQASLRCSPYSNYPSGTGDYNSQRCLGQCMDNRFQICCNGVLCRREYEKCCNSTCCNKFVGTCTDGFRPATPGNRHNYIELRVRYEVCTQIEQLDPIRAWWIFVLPTYLLAATVLGIAILISVINRSSRRNYSFIERSMMTIAFLTMIFAFPCYFAPVYKYGVWVIFVSMVTVLASVSRLSWLNILTVALQALTLLYLFDPFHGNNYFTFASLRVAPGGKHEESFPDPESAGLLPSVHKMFKSLDSVRVQAYCTKWYDYFMLDPQLHDFDRWHNKDVPTFGYCTRGWVTALLVFEGFVLMLTMFQFVLDLVALILRFREERSSEPIELEVRGADEVAPLPYY